MITPWTTKSSGTKEFIQRTGQKFENPYFQSASTTNNGHVEDLHFYDEAREQPIKLNQVQTRIAKKLAKLKNKNRVKYQCNQQYKLENENQ